MTRECAYLSYDGFARQATVRRQDTNTAGCDWCGQFRRGRLLWQYGTQRDDSLSGRVNWHRGLFCSKGCHDDFHSN